MLVWEPIFFFLFSKYKLVIFLNIIIKKITSKTKSKVSKNCKSIFKKSNTFGLIKAKNVSILSPIQIIESKTINLKCVVTNNTYASYYI